VRAAEIPAFLKDSNPQPVEPSADRYDFTPHILNVLQHLHVDALIAIGGDDTLSYAGRLHQEGFPVVAIPKTMDNDVFGTDYCIGFSTAVTRSVDLITALRTPTGSHERIAVIELFGRNCGETALFAAYLSHVDRAVIPEVPFDINKLGALLEQDKRENPSNYAILAISEGAMMIGGEVIETGEQDAYGHRKLGGIGSIIGELLKKVTGENIIYQQLGYLMRSGAPDSLDRMVALSYANLATDLVANGRSGRMVALRDGKYTHVPMSTLLSGTKRVDVDELYDREHYRPKVADMLGKPMFLY
jgi:6-phosphofructokinase 1